MLDPAVLHNRGQSLQCWIRSVSSLGAMLRREAGDLQGDEVVVELITGQRHEGTVIFVSGSDVGVRFRRPIDVVSLINRKLVSQPAERRLMPRVEIRCSAWVKKGSEFSPALLRNISAGGLQLEADELPAIGTVVNIFVEGLGIPAGELIWRRDRVAGVQFQQELSWKSILPWIRDLTRTGRSCRN